MHYCNGIKAKFTPEDLRQIIQESLERLRKHEFINMTLRLVALAIGLHEKSNLDSTNSYRPPFSDSPYPKGILCWVWMAITQNIAVYQIGTRKKEQLLKLITEAFFGWLVTDGYGAYPHQRTMKE